MFEKEGTLLNHGFLGELLYSHICDLNGKKLGCNGAVDEQIQDRMYQVGAVLARCVQGIRILSSIQTFELG